ncbi:uroporphyrinogen-III C-methyltransferase [Longirhabdus pacifica]|uniref:uroporphyrinogen-III C-methyltransferase n=1 Tax=Longirhabdus pacifica TaxID=2305227 RepID=UPI001008E121|nr:uroporphyrinogen-III C-methyltransferase [Longirhabdus pacifica]
MEKGKVFLVGAGPGDPKLITVRGLEALQKADVVVYDRLSSPVLLRKLKPGTELVYVGKRPDRHTMKQEDINQLLVDLALEGKTVTRLKGGDPCIFGRVGEEAQLLVDHDITFEIVPGISSITAVPAYAGIPITHRSYNSSFAVVTGHEKEEKLDSTIQWDQLGKATETIVFLMGVAKIAYITKQLIKHGKSKTTPVALIRWGTRVEQETLVGTLDTIAAQVEAQNFKPPAVILVGEVVKLRAHLQWYEKKPLFGKRILVTRARDQASQLVERIDEWGGEALEFPVIETRLSEEKQHVHEIKQAFANLSSYQRIIFTSVNGVKYFFELMFSHQYDIRSLYNIQINAVGAKTAEVLREKGLFVTQLPGKYQQEGLLEQVVLESDGKEKILFPRSLIARPYLIQQLQDQGHEVHDIPIYDTIKLEQNAEDIVRLLHKKAIHMITFTSSSTVTNLMTILQKYENDLATLLAGIQIACIGPITAETAASFGLHVDVMAKEATVASLLDAILSLSIKGE